MIPPAVHSVGLYCRLSRDDTNFELESMSIENQRQFLSDYAQEQNWTVYKIYADDGWTGTNFERPDFKRMIADVEAGKIDCIIVKDLSRLTRDYVDGGRFTEEYFPEHGIRFIAVNDGIDTGKDSSSNDLMAFHHVFNSFYPKQVSKKVKQVKQSRAKQGKFMNSLAPYGLMKSPADKHVLIEDDYAARIVRRIFTEYAAGDSGRIIGQRLTEEGVDSPTFYYYAKLGRKNPNPKHRNEWGSATVMQILRNEAYLGHMIQHKREIVSIKTKKVRAVAPESWIRVENTHPAIISQELWDRVHARKAGHSRVYESKRDKTVGLFSSIIRCADCGSPMAFMRKELKGGDKGVYRCSRYNNKGGKACTTHYIEEAALAAFVINDIRKYAALAANEREQLASRLMASRRKAQNSDITALKTGIRKAEKRLSDIADLMKALFEEKFAGTLTESAFKSLMDSYATEQVALKERLPKLQQELASIQEAADEIGKWLTLIEGCVNLETLDRPTAMGLIDSVRVYERVKTDGQQTQEIEIQYRFIGNLLNNPEEDAGP